MEIWQGRSPKEKDERALEQLQHGSTTKVYNPRRRRRRRK